MTARKRNKWTVSVGFGLRLAGYFLYHVVKLMPRNKNKWCFDDLHAFGNSRFLCLELIEQHSHIRAVCITQDASYRALRHFGFEAFHWLSPRGIWHCLTAGVYIVTVNTRQINPYLSGGALYVNLWHGNGLKACVWNSEMRAQTLYGKSLTQIARSFYWKINLFSTYFRKPDLALSTSPFLTRHLFAPQFRIPRERFIEANLPRNTVFSWSRERLLAYIRRYEPTATRELVASIAAFRKVYIYMPTWRDAGGDLTARAGVDFERLDKLMRHSNELFIIKLHPSVAIDRKTIAHCSHIRIMDPQTDACTILPFTDLLITDYSSVYFDYLQLNREIILFPFDLNEYLTDSRELMFDYAQYMPAVRAETFDDLLALIESHADCRVEGRDRIMHLFWESCNGGTDIIQAIRQRQINKKR
ncbi:MAG: CDP-glycerol glycerophosphotransferase family protein [Tannerella sp.]|jgi:CDP-glycerol glycerophosphotransferase (TagB/SpsB family)|nr:CDP-glycerol glycerophosphotransferase family protein [Tannerella sp.]